MIVAPYQEGPHLTTVRNSIAPAFVFSLVFGQLVLLPMPSELMQQDSTNFRFSRTLKVQKK